MDNLYLLDLLYKNKNIIHNKKMDAVQKAFSEIDSISDYDRFVEEIKKKIF